MNFCLLKGIFFTNYHPKARLNHHFGDFFYKLFVQPPNKQIQVKDTQKHDMVVSFSLVPFGFRKLKKSFDLDWRLAEVGFLVYHQHSFWFCHRRHAVVKLDVFVDLLP